MSSVAEDSFDFGRTYTVEGEPRIAWRITAYEEVDDADTEWTGYRVRTGRVLGHMVGDDRTESFDPDELVPIPDHAYCLDCGQVGCPHGALPAPEEADA